MESFRPARALDRRFTPVLPLLVLLLLLSADVTLTRTAGPVDTGSGVTGTAVFVGVGGGAASTASRLRVRVRVLGGPLMLGVPRTLSVRMHNGYAFPLSVRSVRGVALRPAAAGCDPAWVTVKAFRAGKKHSAPRVKAGGRTKLRTQVTLVNLPAVDQDACKGVAVRLSLKVRVRKA